MNLPCTEPDYSAMGRAYLFLRVKNMKLILRVQNPVVSFLVSYLEMFHTHLRRPKALISPPDSETPREPFAYMLPYVRSGQLAGLPSISQTSASLVLLTLH